MGLVRNQLAPPIKKWRMGMNTRKLYKGRYLIALYDKNDMLVDVGLNPFDLLTCGHRPRTLYETLCRDRNGIFGYTIHLIDCLEKHDDIFAEEDKIFLDELLLTKEYSVEERIIAKAKELGISKRTAYRWKAQGKLKGF
jgi:hypothetical protein